MREKPRDRYRVVIESTARIKNEYVVEAKNKAAAETEGLKKAENEELDFSGAKVTRKAVRIVKE